MTVQAFKPMLDAAVRESEDPFCFLVIPSQQRQALKQQMQALETLRRMLEPLRVAAQLATSEAERTEFRETLERMTSRIAQQTDRIVRAIQRRENEYLRQRARLRERINARQIKS